MLTKLTHMIRSGLQANSANPCGREGAGGGGDEIWQPW